MMSTHWCDDKKFRLFIIPPFLNISDKTMGGLGSFIVDLRINETPKSAQLETVPTKQGSESVYLFFEFTIILPYYNLNQGLHG